MNNPPFDLSRRLFLHGSIAAAVAASLRAYAQSAPAQGEISPLMRTISTYIANAANNPPPEAVIEVTKHHLLDTLAAMISAHACSRANWRLPM